MSFEALTYVSIKVMVFCDIMLRSLNDKQWRFQVNYCPHFRLAIGHCACHELGG